MSKEITALRTVVLQNRMMLDLVTASSKGVCALLNETCCTYILMKLEMVTLSDKEQLRNLHESYHNEASDVAWYGRAWGPTLKPGLGSGLVSENLVAGLLLTGPCRAKPEQEL
ncbi:hypothetical protein CRENBAI_025078 [Crenichthys baileyi]|uniref:Uncharacterized protein n=1 Tax=Crenichthys baileyi TaxID=28760 RepID=A0AAV9QZ58_9TELE